MASFMVIYPIPTSICFPNLSLFLYGLRQEEGFRPSLFPTNASTQKHQMKNAKNFLRENIGNSRKKKEEAWCILLV